MANMFKRIKDILASNVSDWLSNMEDPEKMLPYKIDEMKTELVKATDATAEAMAIQRQTEMRLADIQADIKKYNFAAEKAADKGNDDLARKCLGRVITLEKQEEANITSLETQETTTEKLKEIIEALKAKIEEAEIRMDELVARNKAAKAQEKVTKVMGNINVGDLGTTFDDLEKKVIKREQKAAALAELGGSKADSLDDEIAEYSEEDEITKRLNSLKGA
ncbi:MAG: PspA/IM30 family protein [Caldisericia bacterium]